MKFLVLNRRRPLDYLPEAFPDRLGDLVVLTDQATLARSDVAARLIRRLRHVEVAADYDAPQTDAVIERLCRDHRHLVPATKACHTATPIRLMPAQRSRATSPHRAVRPVLPGAQFTISLGCRSVLPALRRRADRSAPGSVRLGGRCRLPGAWRGPARAPDLA
jgi:hypothetical protein